MGGATPRLAAIVLSLDLGKVAQKEHEQVSACRVLEEVNSSLTLNSYIEDQRVMKGGSRTRHFPEEYPWLDLSPLCALARLLSCEQISTALRRSTLGS